jgi:glyoxylase-like metal-dependent hydrolase (beta-lactamase superfamily II)
MGLDAITERFPHAQIVSTPNVVADIRENGPWMFSLLRDKLGPEGPTKLVVPEALPEPALHIERAGLDIIEFGEGESKHMACLYIPDAKALLSADMVYNNAHLYLQERRLESWLAQLDELEVFARDRVSTIYPGHGAPADLTVISRTRTYLSDFANAVKSGDAKTAEQRILAKYPDHHVRQFLTLFSLPAYFPPASST